ncbi:MAG: HdeD family acid-resistance protein [Candidatus Cryptobacteroides sp.]
MITFGYNSKFSSILRSLSAIAIGLVMVISTNATVTVVKIIAAFLFAAGVVSFVYGYLNRRSGAMSLMTVNAVVDIVIGLLLFLFPTAVAGIIVTLIGIAILLFAVLQLVVLSGTLSLVGMGGFSLVLCIIALVGGITLLFNPFSERVMSILAGVFLVVYGISDLLSMFRVTRAKEAYEIKFGQENRETQQDGNDVPESLADVKDVEYRKE